jgi:hypothetical protein
MQIAVFADMNRVGALLLVSATLVQAMTVDGACAEELSVPITYTPIVRTPPDSSGRPDPAPSTPSRAAQASAQVQAPPTVRHWYGDQVLRVDGASIILGLVAAKAGNGDSGLMVMAAGWVFGAPVVHAVHRRPGAALASLAMRAGLLLGAYYEGGPRKTTCTTAVGSCADDPHASDSWQTTSTTFSGAIGLLLGGMIASALDSALLSWEEVPSAAMPRASTPMRHCIGIDSAGVFPINAGAGLSLGGHF